MGEYAEMMLDGTCCENCGEYIGQGTGYPGYCSSQCAAESGIPTEEANDKPHKCPVCKKGFKTEGGMKMHRQTVHADRRKVDCPGCGKRVKAAGLQMHMEAKGCGNVPHSIPDPDDDFDVLED